MRVSALCARFLLFFVLASYLPPEEVGLYGLISATVSYSAIFMGIDFYQYSNRELRQADDKDKFPILLSSSYIYAISYIIAAPLISIIFFANIIPWGYFLLIFFILILEHIGQETYRILIMVGRNLLAGWILFLRLGFWVFVVALAMYIEPSYRNIETVLTAWWLGALLSLAFAIKPILSLKSGAKARTMGKDWLVKGLKVAVPLLIGTLCLRATVTFDRYLMEMVNSREILGVYVFFAGMAATLPAILEAGVLSFTAPRLISAAKNQNNLEYNKIVNRAALETIFISFIFTATVAILINEIVDKFENKIYENYYEILFLCIISQATISLSNIYSMAIYAKRLDTHVTKGNAIGLAAFLTSFALLQNFFSLLSVPFALIICNSAVLIYKYAIYMKNSREK